MDRIAFWQGAFMPVEQVSISADDRGYYFGDGVYEVAMAFRGKAFSLEAHLRRWEFSLGEVRLESPYPREEMERIIAQALGHIDAPQVLVYFQQTRGVSPRRHGFPPAGTPGSFLLTAQAFADDEAGLAQGAQALLCEDQRWGRCDIKSLNLLPNILATQRAADEGAQVAVFLRNGVITECASANFFAVHGGRLLTHPLGREILGGTTRADILALARELNIPYEEQAFGTNTLFAAEEAFCTSVATRPMGIVKVDGRPIGEGRVGPVTRRLQAAYAELVAAQCP